MAQTINTPYGELHGRFIAGKLIHYSEDAHVLETKHFVDKVNYRKPVPLDELINDRNILKQRIKNTPDIKRIPQRLRVVFSK